VTDLGICETSYSLEASYLQGPSKISDLLSKQFTWHFVYCSFSNSLCSFQAALYLLL